MISFDEFKKQFEERIKNQALTKDQSNSYYKPVDIHTFGDQPSGVRIAEILNEFQDPKYRKRVHKFLNFSIRCYKSLLDISDKKSRLHIANIVHAERKSVLKELKVPEILRSHMFTYIAGRYRGVIKQ